MGTPSGPKLVNASAAASDLVIIPGGQRPRSFVHQVEEGHVIDGSEGKLRKFTASGEFLEDFGPHVRSGVAAVATSGSDGEPFMPDHVVLPDSTPQGAPAPTQAPDARPDGQAPATFKNGWITYSSWTNSTGTPVSRFSTTWTVPPAPISRVAAAGSYEIVYLFNGIQNSGNIYQPVLQWGYNGFGGGPYWVVGSWYVGGTNAFHTNFVRVNPGDVITGVMTLTGQSGTKFSYNCEFTGIAGTSLPINNIDQLYWCIETLETYGMSSALTYPPSYRISMRNVNLACGPTHPTITWTANNPVTDCGQHTTIISNSTTNGEVDLVYGTVGPQSISAVAWTSNRLDIFGLGLDDATYHKWWDGNTWGPSTTGWESLGGRCNSTPAAVSWAPGRLDLFVLGTDNAMYHKYFSGAWGPSLGGWQGIGGTFNSPPSVVSWGRNRLDIFGLGTDNQCYHKWWQDRWGPSQTGWEGLGGVFNSPISVVSWGADRLDLLGLGTDNQMYHKSYDGVRGWQPSQTGWEGLGGIFNSAPCVVSWGPNRLDVFGLGTDNSLYHKWWDGNAWGPSKTGWDSQGGGFNSMPVATSWGPNRIDIFGIGLDNGMYHKAWNGNAWSGYDKMGAETFDSPPTVVSWGVGRIDLFGLGAGDNGMWHRAWNGSSWGPAGGVGWESLGGVFDST